MAYNTKPIITDKDSNPISQYYNPDTDQYEPVMGAGGGNRVIVYKSDGTESSASLLPILEKLGQLTGSVIDEETRKSNELQRVELYNQIFQMLADGDLKGDKGDIGLTGEGLEFEWLGTQLGVRVEGQAEYVYVDLKGEKGDKGETGDMENLNAQHIEDALGYIPLNKDHDEDIFAHGNLKGAVVALEDNLADTNQQLNEKADYEEGSWTPTLYGSSIAGTNTYSIQNGKYIRTGNKVTCFGYIVLSAKDVAMDGQVRIGGLPISGGGGSAKGSVGFGDIRNLNVPSGGIFPMAYVAQNFVDIFFARSGTTPIAVSPIDIKNNTGLIFTIEYYIG